jgi:menaquinone-dependent protoporphyrinogen oxidase
MTGTFFAHQMDMKAAIFFATREGHTRKIADRLAADLRALDVDTDLFDVSVTDVVDWSKYAVACVAASVHLGHHELEMIDFVTRHRTQLERLSAPFISVTLSEAGAEDPKRTAAEREQAAADVQKMIDVFVTDTGWRPDRVLPVAGALAYTKYNFLVRFIMKRIARKAGAPTDTSRDYEFTDWPGLDRFAGELTGWAERRQDPTTAAPVAGDRSGVGAAPG